MEINFELDLGGFFVKLVEQFDAADAPKDPMDHIKKRVEQAKANGIAAYKRPVYGGGRNGNGNHAPEAWALAKGARWFEHSGGKKALAFDLVPEAGSLTKREAASFDPDPMIASLPPTYKAAFEKASAATKREEKELALDGTGIEVGFYKDGERLKAVAIRMAGANGSTTDQKGVV